MPWRRLVAAAAASMVEAAASVAAAAAVAGLRTTAWLSGKSEAGAARRATSALLVRPERRTPSRRVRVPCLAHATRDERVQGLIRRLCCVCARHERSLARPGLGVAAVHVAAKGNRALPQWRMAAGAERSGTRGRGSRERFSGEGGDIAPGTPLRRESESASQRDARPSARRAWALGLGAEAIRDTRFALDARDAPPYHRACHRPASFATRLLPQRGRGWGPKEQRAKS